MKTSYLEVTFRRGRPLAAYLYLPREPGARSVRCVQANPGLVIDYDAQGTAIGIEITAPNAITVEDLNKILETLSLPLLDTHDLAPLAA